MSNNHDTKSNTTGDTSQDATNQDPPPPRTAAEQGGGGSSSTNSSRGTTPYDGGANEGTPLVQQQQQQPPQYTYSAVSNPQYVPGGIPQPEAVKLPQNLTDKSDWTTCPHCKKVVMSRTEHKSGSCTWLSCVGLFFLVGTAICSFIPFCVDRTKDVIHYCPNCSKIIVKYSRFHATASSPYH